MERKREGGEREQASERASESRDSIGFASIFHSGEEEERRTALLLFVSIAHPPSFFSLSFHPGAHTLLWAGLFYGVSQSFVWRGATGIVPTGRRLRPGWAWYTVLGTSLAWLLAAHTLSRMPPLELVRAWMGDTAPKVRPLLGAMPAALRNSLKAGAGVEVV